MRFLSNLIFVIMLALILSTGWAFWNNRESKKEQVEFATLQVDALQRAINVRAVRELGPLNEFGFPPTIDPEWFSGQLPTNPLLDHERPWLEIAAGEDLYAQHPRDPVAVNRSKAEFWYNPRRGIVRGRVPQMPSDRLTLQTYNEINGTQLDRLFPTAPRPSDVELDHLDGRDDESLSSVSIESDGTLDY